MSQFTPNIILPIVLHKYNMKILLLNILPYLVIVKIIDSFTTLKHTGLLSSRNDKNLYNVKRS